jgi:hypothetical protein
MLAKLPFFLQSEEYFKKLLNISHMIGQRPVTSVVKEILKAKTKQKKKKKLSL